MTKNNKNDKYDTWERLNRPPDTKIDVSKQTVISKSRTLTASWKCEIPQDMEHYFNNSAKMIQEEIDKEIVAILKGHHHGNR